MFYLRNTREREKDEKYILSAVKMNSLGVPCVTPVKAEL